MNNLLPSQLESITNTLHRDNLQAEVKRWERHLELINALSREEFETFYGEQCMSLEHFMLVLETRLVIKLKQARRDLEEFDQSM